MKIKEKKSYITTFAFELYYKIKDEFRAASFVVDVGKHLRKNTANGLEYLEKELLSDMVVETKQELQQKRVLLVLEGVDSKEQLELLAGVGIVDWFGPGSRIIITTENKDLFQNYSPVMNGVELETHCIREGEIVGSNWIVKEKHVVGFVKDFIDVINQLREEDSRRRNVVSIVGMGGSGKTTLAQKIYGSKVVREVFPCRAWATVSKDYRDKEVFSSLFRCLMPSDERIPENEEELKCKVRGCLNEKRRKYLVVLDDVWDIQVWDKLKDYVLPNKNNGSRVLVTTRNDQVANYARSKEPHHKLLLLNEEESWELFYNEVFGGEVCPPDLETIGKSIAKSCNGLPLAIKTIAGIVAKRERSEDAWEEIKNLLPYWCVAEDKEGKKMMEILKLSYDDLSEKIKPCFLYLGVFPEDEEIWVRDLIHLWIAEGFIKPIQSGRTKAPPPEPEDIGEQYLKELVDRNLVQVEKRRSDGKGVKTCRIHDLIREVCISESNNPDNSNNARRLSFPRDIGTYACSVTCDQSCTRSLFVYGDENGWLDYIPEGCQVNVLYFEGLNMDLIRTENLEHLKRLTSIRFLRMYLFNPGGLCRLQCSHQTLHILDNCMENISIKGLKQLRHFRCSIPPVHLLVDEEGLKDKMQNLQTLRYVHFDSLLEFLFNTDYFPNLRTLGLWVTQGAKNSAEKTFSLRQLSKLRKLKLLFPTISWNPPIPLDKIAFPSNLSKITLSFFKGLKSKDMNVLGRIPCLQILKLDFVNCREEILNCGTDGSFPRLQVFIMRQVTLKRLTIEGGAMPCLRRAVFDDCPGLKLKYLPEKMRNLGCNLEFSVGLDVAKMRSRDCNLESSEDHDDA